MKKCILVSVDPKVLIEFDFMRGLIPRSTYLNRMMKEEVEKAAVVGSAKIADHSSDTGRKPTLNNELVYRCA